MYIESMDIFPVWLWMLLAGGLLCLAIEVGYRLGKWRHDKAPDEQDQPVGTMVASILGLLALVLGFTFALAGSRFDARRQAVLEEANAIGTAYLRTRLLPEPQQSETRKLLREYIDVRIEGVKQDHPAAAIARSEALHELLWTQAMSASKQSPTVLTGLYVQALNEVIDLHAKRVLVGTRSRIPLVMWLGLFGLAMLGMAAVGYQSGLSITRRSPAMLGLVLAFTLVLLLIADLDRGQDGLLRVGQQALEDAQRSMATEQP